MFATSVVEISMSQLMHGGEGVFTHVTNWIDRDGDDWACSNFTACK
jgi:hypothetical protein